MINPCFNQQLFSQFPVLKHKKSYKLTNTVINDISMNEKTGVLSAITDDSRIILTNIQGAIDKNKDTLGVTTIHISQDNIKKINWLDYYSFVTAGSNGTLNKFNMMNFSSELFFVQQGNIITMRKYGNFLYTGSSKGMINLWDFNNKNSVMSIEHKFGGRLQPIKDLEVHGNFMFSSTLYKGRLWIWDLRNPDTPLKIMETDQLQNKLEFIEGNLYGLGRKGLLKISQKLSAMEYLYVNKEPQECIQNAILFKERYKSIIFNEKDEIKMIYLNEKEGGSSFKCKGILGMDNFESDGFIGYKENGEISIFNIS